MQNADAFSRLPLKNSMSGESVNYFSVVKNSPLSAKDIANETTKDKVLQQVIGFMMSGWPNPKELDAALNSYYIIREQLNLDMNCLMFNNRVIIPTHLRVPILHLLHEQHPGIVKMKMLARQYVYWPDINREIESLVKACECCQLMAGNIPDAPTTSWTWCPRKWQRLHLDLAMKNGIKFLILIDASSKWVDAWILKSTTASDVIACLRQTFSIFGLPDEIHSDNGPPFSSEEFEMFCKAQGIKVLKSPPIHPKSNGITERTIQTFKNNLLKQNFDVKTSIKSIQEKLDNFLFYYRNIPHNMTQTSPAELLLKQKPRTRISMLKPNFNNFVKDKQTTFLEKENREVGLAKYKSFVEGEKVYVKNVRGETAKWSYGIIKVRVSPVTYIVMVENYARHVHVDHLRKCVIYDDQSIKESTPVVLSPMKSLNGSHEIQNSSEGSNLPELCNLPDVSDLPNKSNSENSIEVNPEKRLYKNQETIELRRSVRNIKKPARYLD
uniref:RNA-directed DNA polymerase n=1 Tax=Photinus pyralis TaxID=7054 RepID=A0A1Y1LIR3_PHOPY